MNTITQITTRRQAIIKYAEKKGVTAAARRYNVGRATIYRWKERYDGTLQSLQDRSHRPHSHPNQHTEEEIKLIKDMRKRNKHTGLVVFWVKLRQKGYKRSIPSLWRMLNRLELQPVKPPNPKYIPKLYEKMQYPGQRVQIDVKYVPDACIVGDAKAEGRKFYQYTAIDEYSRFRYLEAFEEHSSHSSKIFLEHMLKAFKFKVECVQTDNGTEFTKRLGSSEKPTLTSFEKKLKELKIKHKLIKPYTPRHNGKVERSHRKDNEYFYATHINATNYYKAIELADEAKHEYDEIKNEVKSLEKEIRELSGAISIAEQVRAGTYVQELVSKENIHRNADNLPNGVFQL